MNISCDGKRQMIDSAFAPALSFLLPLQARPLRRLLVTEAMHRRQVSIALRAFNLERHDGATPITGAAKTRRTKPAERRHADPPSSETVDRCEKVASAMRPRDPSVPCGYGPRSRISSRRDGSKRTTEGAWNLANASGAVSAFGAQEKLQRRRASSFRAAGSRRCRATRGIRRRRLLAR